MLLGAVLVTWCLTQKTQEDKMIDDSNKQSQLILENTKKLIKSFNKSLNLFEKGALGVLLGKNKIQR